MNTSTYVQKKNQVKERYSLGRAIDHEAPTHRPTEEGERDVFFILSNAFFGIVAFELGE